MERQSKPIRRPVQLPIELHKTIKLEAARRDLPMGELIREAMARYLKSSKHKSDRATA